MALGELAESENRVRADKLSLAGASLFPAFSAGKVFRGDLTKPTGMLGERLLEFLENIVHFRGTCDRSFPAEGADAVLQPPRSHDSSVKEMIGIGIQRSGYFLSALAGWGSEASDFLLHATLLGSRHGNPMRRCAVEIETSAFWEK